MQKRFYEYRKTNKNIRQSEVKHATTEIKKIHHIKKILDDKMQYTLL